MFARYLPQPWCHRQPLVKLLDAALLFVALLLAVWLATQRREAPELILLLLLFVITVNFSLPYRFGAAGLVPVVSVTALLLLDTRTALIVTLVGLLLAELARPLWQPIWQSLDLSPPSLPERLALIVVYVSALLAAGIVYAYLGGTRSLSFLDLAPLRTYTFSVVAYAAVYYLLLLLFARLTAAVPARQLLAQAPSILATTLLAQALALFGATALALGGLPVFVIYAFSIVLIAILLWLSWQRRYVLEQRLAQLAVLNSQAASLRGTLDLQAVLSQVCNTVARLLPAASYAVVLQDEDGRWQHHVRLDAAAAAPALAAPEVDDFTAWVARQGRALELNEQNMHFAARHNLQAPSPAPTAWLGVPLQTNNRIIGVLTAQRHMPARPFNRWSREVLLAVAGQASAAIDNAGLYSETLRLYNLTDEALARRLGQLQALLNTMREGVLLLDPAGQVVLVNTVAAQLLGRPADALRDQRLDLAHSAPCLGYSAADLQTRLARLQNDRAEAPGLHDGGTFAYLRPDDPGAPPRYLERMEAAVVAHDERLIGLLMLFRDVTEERELAEQRADLVRMIVHDLRNPVSTFISNMNLVAGMLPGNDDSLLPVRHAVADARDSGLDMLDMVDSLLDVNRLEAGELVLEVEALDLAAVAARALQRLRVVAEKRQIRLTRHSAAGLPPVWADEDIIRRVMVNLLDNALKFTPAGGRVHCEFLVEPSPGVDAEAGVRCIVSDTGPGVSPTDRDKIFERYMRTNRGGAQVRGTGLGLAFCKLAIEAHGGRIWVENHAGGGSKFLFTLPGVPRPPEA